MKQEEKGESKVETKKEEQKAYGSKHKIDKLRCHSNFEVKFHNRRIKSLKEGPKWAYILPTIEENTVETFKIKILSCKDERADCVIGVTCETYEKSFEKWIGKYDNDFGYNLINGNKSNSNDWVPYGKPASKGDIIECKVDWVRGTVEFFKNDKSL